MNMLRFAFILLSPLVLTGCLLTPGQFDSMLTIGRDGTFTFSYRGEIILALPDEGPGQMAELGSLEAEIEPYCWDETEPQPSADAEEEGTEELGYPLAVERECTPEEAAEQRAEYRRTVEESRENQRQQTQTMMRMLGGIDIGDEQTMHAYAARLERQAGWKSVVYRGNHTFEVEYEISGSLDRGLVFPILEGFELLQPMVVITPRDDGSVHIQAPGFAGDSGSRIAPWMLAGMGGPPGGPDAMTLSRANGRFVIRTDGEIRTNNTDEGPSREGGQSVLTWPVDGLSRPKPEALIQTGR